MNSSGALSALVKKTVEGLGYELVDVERLQRGLVRVTIDIERDGGISLEDCERVSDQLTHLFTVEDVSYERLEVSSPGVERPLKRARDWERFTGELAWVELFAPLKAEGFPEAAASSRAASSAFRGNPAQSRLNSTTSKSTLPARRALPRCAPAKSRPSKLRPCALSSRFQRSSRLTSS